MTMGQIRMGQTGVVATLLVLAACGRDELPPRSTVELMDDPIMLQAVLGRCNQGDTLHDRECRNAREAVERLEADQSVELVKRKEAQTQSDFERAREQRRQREELELRRQEARQSVDPYTMPLVQDPAPEQKPGEVPDAASSKPPN